MAKKSVEFEFVISDPNGPTEHYRIIIEPHNPITKCKILAQYEPIVDQCWRNTAFGIGVCKHGDTYDMETGCRMALKSALRTIKQDDIRAAAWKAYLEAFPVESRKKVNDEGDKQAAIKLISRLIAKSIAGASIFGNLPY